MSRLTIKHSENHRLEREHRGRGTTGARGDPGQTHVGSLFCSWDFPVHLRSHHTKDYHEWYKPRRWGTTENWPHVFTTSMLIDNRGCSGTAVA